MNQPMKNFLIVAWVCSWCITWSATCIAQTESDNANKPTADANAEVVSMEGAKTIILAPGREKELAFLYTAKASADVKVDLNQITQSIELEIKRIQGKGKTIRLGLHGQGDVKSVTGDGIEAWSLRTQGNDRFLELQINESLETVKANIQVVSEHKELPVELDLAHLTPGKSIGFSSVIRVAFVPSIVGKTIAVEGFSPLATESQTQNFQTSTGGKIRLRLDRQSAFPQPIELVDTNLVGKLNPNGKFVEFRFTTKAIVTKENAKLSVLSGNVAISQLPESDNFRLQLAPAAQESIYELVALKTGEFPIELEFVAPIVTPNANWQGLDFKVAASAVVPIAFEGLDSELEFVREPQSIVPVLQQEMWSGFLPASGRVHVQWKNARSTSEGKLFFTTTARIETQVGPGLLRQDHQIDYQVLQGQLKSLSVQLHGPGEILDVSCPNLVGWEVREAENQRRLEITLSQPITSTSQLKIRSQTPLDAFPVRVEAMRLQPLGAIRHSGFLRIGNSGSVRIEPTALTGLTQLAPEQYPGEAIEARQLFVYRFPSADYAFSLIADRIQPEVNISQLVIYTLSEAEKVLSADIELDIREAPIREWDFSVPVDYSVVAVTGAALSDYVIASDATDGMRNLKVIFGQDVQGRQLVSMRLEKSEAAGPGEWVLPRLLFPQAKSIRGDIGVVGAPGFRIVVGKSELLVEKPLSYFPKPVPHLQQAFRIREPQWSATMQIEQLERSVQSDVFHLYSLSQGTVYGSALINYFVTGAPTSEWQLSVPASLGNVTVDGQDIRTWRRDGDKLIVTLHQPVMSTYTLLVTFEEKPDPADGAFSAGRITPLNVQGDRGYIEVVSPMQVEIEPLVVSDQLLVLDPLELPAEFRLLSTAPSLGTWQYTERPIELRLKVKWFEPGTTATQVVEFSEANSRVSADGELVTDVLYYVKSRGQRTLRLKLPGDPVRLWAVSVNGQPVTARKSDDETLVPLPGNADPNVPIEVTLRIGKPSVSEDRVTLVLPKVFTPVLKTEWKIVGDENHTLLPQRGTVAPNKPVLWPNGFDYLATRGSISVIAMTLFTLLGTLALMRGGWVRLAGLFLVVIGGLSGAAAAVDALMVARLPEPIQLSLPVVAEGADVSIEVANVPTWRSQISWPGVVLCVVGLAILAVIVAVPQYRTNRGMRVVSFLLLAVGALLQANGAVYFFGLFTILIICFLVIPGMIALVNHSRSRWMAYRKTSSEKKVDGGEAKAVVTSWLLLACLISAANSVCTHARADGPAPNTQPAIQTANKIVQTWSITNKTARLTAKGTITVTGRPGDQFTLLKAPAVLTRFEGEGLRLAKQEVPEQGVVYSIAIPIDEANADADKVNVPKNYQAEFEYQLEALKVTEGVPVLTGRAALQQIDLEFDEAGWDVTCASAARIEPVKSETSKTVVKLLLGSGQAPVVLSPQARDVTKEATQFFVEGAQVYIPGPGVVDGRHRLNIRASQGRVKELSLIVPEGLTVSAVNGPVAAWQFDADKRRLHLEIDGTAQANFSVMIETQRGLDPLPTEVSLAPMRVEKAGGEVGLIAAAFGSDAQPEKVDAEKLSLVSLSDFDAALLANSQAVLHRVYRYGAEEGLMKIRVAPVAPEIRVVSRQVLSLGDERIVLAVNFTAEISRTGLFQLSFPLPAGLEVESLTGDALHHWAEITENDKRQVVLHLNGKTIGAQKFTLSLTGAAPNSATDWEVPRFELNEALRQSGDLVVRPSTGIRLRAVSRQNVSESDPRALGGEGQGALAYRLLQRDWSLVLGIETLTPWVTGQVLHEVMLREGQTRSTVIADFQIQNASIRSLPVTLPLTNQDEIKTVRVSGKAVSDFVRTAPDSNVWEVQFKRRVMGQVQFQIEFERRGDRANDTEQLMPVSFPDARQLAYFFSIRTGGRLELEPGNFAQGWQRADWNMVPAALRQAGNRSAPVLALRALAPTTPMSIRVIRHSLADSLKLRVAEGTLTSVLSPTGDQLTAVDVTMEVIQRSSLSLQLPEGSELFSIFVNGESVQSIRQKDKPNGWQFFILPGIDDRTAKVRFVYLLTGRSLRNLRLTSPQLNVPLENVKWNVIAPEGFQLVDHDGNLELVSQDQRGSFDRAAYLSLVSGGRQLKAQQATQLLEQAGQLLQAGEQSKASWALNNVANQFALDAASNEDARVQLENLQTQQAVVGLNTRRQRMYLDSNRSDSTVADNEQLRQAAAVNPILQQDQLNFRPQELSQLLAGNTNEDNAVLQQIAARLVQHQRTTEPAPQAILISVPEEGTVYSFSRSVQVAENAPLELELKFHSEYALSYWQWGLVAIVIVLLIGCLAIYSNRGARA